MRNEILIEIIKNRDDKGNILTYTVEGLEYNTLKEAKLMAKRFI